MNSYSYSFLSVVFGHDKPQQRTPLKQSDCVLISIGNNHGGLDRWEIVCSIEPSKKSKQNVMENYSLSDNPQNNMYYKAEQAQKSGFFFNIFKSNTDHHGKPWYKKESKDSYFKLSEIRDSHYNVRVATHDIVGPTELERALDGFHVHTYSVFNPPKSTSSHKVIAFGVGSDSHEPKECFFMKIYSTLSLPDKSSDFESRSLLFEYLIEQFNYMQLRENDMIGIYDYCCTKLEQVYNSNEMNAKTRLKKQQETIRTIYDIDEKNLKAYIQNYSNIVDCGPLTLLFFFNKFNNEHKPLCELSTFILSVMRLKEEKVINWFDSCCKHDSNNIKVFNLLSIQNGVPSPKSVRMLMKELSTFSTRHANRHFSHVCIAFSAFLKGWVETKLNVLKE